jgi:hypothetical protein
MSNNTRPFQQGGTPTPEQMQAFAKLASIMRGSQKQEYTPVLKSLEAIGVEYKVIDVMLGDVPTECVVIPLQDLMYREWSHMSATKPQGEESNES